MSGDILVSVEDCDGDDLQLEVEASQTETVYLSVDKVLRHLTDKQRLGGVDPDEIRAYCAENDIALDAGTPDHDAIMAALPEFLSHPANLVAVLRAVARMLGGA